MPEEKNDFLVVKSPLIPFRPGFSDSLGGGIWLVLLILLSLKSVYLGLFKSNNKLCKGFAFIIVVYYIDMIGFGIATISLGYMMVFIAISICCNKQFRRLTDEDLMYKIGLE